MLESFYLAKYVRDFFFRDINVIFVNVDDYSITVVRDKLSSVDKLGFVDVRRVLTCLRCDLSIKYRSLVDIWCVDYRTYFGGVGFELNYKFNSLKFPNISLIYSVHLLQEISSFPVYVYSVSSFIPSANWLEREIWDLYGIFFYGHLDLRRILTDYGFIGYPLRKDYPVTGYTEARYEDTKGYILYDPVSFTQGFRGSSKNFASWYEEGKNLFFFEKGCVKIYLGLWLV